MPRLRSNVEEWIKLKEDYLANLLEERLVAYLDPGAEEVLRKINSLEGVVTTSSCMGRVTVVEAKYPWERREESRIVLKVHRAVSVPEVATLIARPFEDLWLKVSGPILHMRVFNEKCASKLLEILRESGFKHSGLISLERDSLTCCTLEVNSPTQLISPLKVEGRILVRGEELRLLVKRANEILEEGRARLRGLLKRLEKVRPFCLL